MKKILLVEDDSNQGLLYEQELEDEGYQVVRAANGREGVEMARREHPDCVILDINMPVMDGIEAMGKILAEQPRLPVIINTAYPCYQDNFMSWSANAYVCKSVDLTELMTRIREVLRDEAPKKGVSDHAAIPSNFMSDRFEQALGSGRDSRR